MKADFGARVYLLVWRRNSVGGERAGGVIELGGVVGGFEDGGEGAAAGGGEIDDAGFGAGALEGAVGSAVEFGAGKSNGGYGAVVEVAADVGGGDAVGEDFVGVRGAAADIERDGAAGLAG